MAFQDKTLTCSDCGKEFTFTTSEQEYFQSRGYTNSPKRCMDCRKTRQSQGRSNGGGSGSGNYRGGTYTSPREMFDATCAQCGKATKVPFEPRSGRPVYCSDCYSKVRVNR
jgi:CxxC-x17-CxxC domain-containing protein